MLIVFVWTDVRWRTAETRGEAGGGQGEMLFRSLPEILFRHDWYALLYWLKLVSVVQLVSHGTCDTKLCEFITAKCINVSLWMFDWDVWVCWSRGLAVNIEAPNTLSCCACMERVGFILTCVMLVFLWQFAIFSYNINNCCFVRIGFFLFLSDYSRNWIVYFHRSRIVFSHVI